MEDLIKALQIFMKYKNQGWPTNCDHDILCIMDIKQDAISDEDIKTLDTLGFLWSSEHDCYASFRFGSA